LTLEAPVADFTQSVEEDRPSKRVACLPLVKTGVRASPEIDVGLSFLFLLSGTQVRLKWGHLTKRNF
jgi:hypothetical protein